MGEADHHGTAHSATRGAAKAGKRWQDDAYDRLAEIHAVAAGAAGPGFSAGTAEETDGRHGVGICIRRFRPGGGATHAAAALPKDDGQAGDHRSALPHAAAQLRHAAAGAGGRRQDGERAAGAQLGKDDVGFLRPQPDGQAAFGHGAAGRLLKA